jgi:hypothetical protein
MGLCGLNVNMLTRRKREGCAAGERVSPLGNRA